MVLNCITGTSLYDICPKLATQSVYNQIINPKTSIATEASCLYAQLGLRVPVAAAPADRRASIIPLDLVRRKREPFHWLIRRTSLCLT